MSEPLTCKQKNLNALRTDALTELDFENIDPEAAAEALLLAPKYSLVTASAGWTLTAYEFCALLIGQSLTARRWTSAAVQPF